MELVERHGQLADLDAALRDATAGRGSLVLVAGAAGAGKTALVRQFTSTATTNNQVLWGICDELATPRPLGPFRDMVQQLGDDDAIDARSGPWPELLDAMTSELARPPHPRVVLVEDMHWADEATLDAMRFLGRRVGRLSALFVVTFRDDEVPADHPLRQAIGAIPPDDIRRIALPPLTRKGVAELARQDDVEVLYRLTGGNPFYVTEILATPGSDVPPTVQDVVLARVARLSDDAQASVDIVAVVPGRVEKGVLEHCDVVRGVEEAARLGVLDTEGAAVRFTHELARQAAEGSLPPERRQTLHRRVLEALVARDAEPARLTHHAVQAADAEAVARFAPLAARRAASLGSRREAVVHFRQALDHTERLSPAELGALWFDYARECYLTERHEDAESALRAAIEIHTELADQAWLGEDLSLLSEVTWFLGRGDDAESASASAVEVLEGLPNPSEALGRAYAQQAKLAMVDYRHGDAVSWGEKAITVARPLGDSWAVAHALNTIGMAQWIVPPFDNGALLESLELAQANGMATQASRAYANLAVGYILHLEYDRAGALIAEGLAFCDEHDLSTAHNWLLAHRAEWHLEQGRWTEAQADAERILSARSASRIPVLAVLGVLQARQGVETAESTCQEALRLADRIGDRQNRLKAGLATLELAWLRGGRSDMSALARDVLDLAERTQSSHYLGEAALWLHRAGVRGQPPADAFEPYALHITGRCREAAAAWREVGRPYAEADALADAAEPDALLRALEILHRLGAAPRAAMVRRRLAGMGVTSVPRGPREPTRASPAGLTARQTEVLRLLAEDLTYEQIARRLYLSVKTVDHHVAAIRNKLSVRTRADAVRAGRRLGILQ